MSTSDLGALLRRPQAAPRSPGHREPITPGAGVQRVETVAGAAGELKGRGLGHQQLGQTILAGAELSQTFETLADGQVSVGGTVVVDHALANAWVIRGASGATLLSPALLPDTQVPAGAPRRRRLLGLTLFIVNGAANGFSFSGAPVDWGDAGPPVWTSGTDIVTLLFVENSSPAGGRWCAMLGGSGFAADLVDP